MLTFKELLHEDIKTVFMNPDEFGEIHSIDGKRMKIIVDGLEVVERGKKQLDKYVDGVYKKQIILYVARDDFGLLPAIGRKMTMDKSEYRVTDAINEGGIYSITVEAVK